ncbi:MAG: hypothetical protein VKK94_05970 [Cyanobacteriota bacterium]|nr:hypothetical protein [Cyanobacteriota bacterium]
MWASTTRATVASQHREAIQQHAGFGLHLLGCLLVDRRDASALQGRGRSVMPNHSHGSVFAALMDS